jgi:hypothetical protein
LSLARITAQAAAFTERLRFAGGEAVREAFELDMPNML